MVTNAVKHAAMQAKSHEDRLATRTASTDLRPRANPVRMVAAVPMDNGTMNSNELKFRAT